MNIENQNIEWKESWRDEYIRWIGGFANANGGKLIIGMNNRGEITGLAEAEELLETIPNKVRDILGIIVDVNLETKKGKKYLEINIEPHPFPVSYKGQYHYRSGSTKQELKGNALDRFLLRKQGKRWDGVPVPKVSVNELSQQAFDYFIRKARSGKRLNIEILDESHNDLLEKLHLKEADYLKRAAILLFHPDPEKYVTGAYVKIGFFNDKEILVYQDEIHGYLFEQVEKTMDLLLTKYMKAMISYEGLHRVETYPFPETALREALLNAIAHKDYSSGNPIQISVYDYKIIFWNEGQLPENWTVEQLTLKHPSVPFNPDIANAFFRAGLIEAWGQGIFRIINDCAKSNLPPPVFKYDLSGFVIELRKQPGEPVEKTVEKTVEKILRLIRKNPEITSKELQQETGLTRRGVEYNLGKLKSDGLIKRSGPDKGGRWIVLK